MLEVTVSEARGVRFQLYPFPVAPCSRKLREAKTELEYRDTQALHLSLRWGRGNNRVVSRVIRGSGGRYSHFVQSLAHKKLEETAPHPVDLNQFCCPFPGGNVVI